MRKSTPERPLGVPSKDTIEGYSKGFFDAVNCSDPELAEFGELRLKAAGMVERCCLLLAIAG
jgi:hypothetical protein